MPTQKEFENALLIKPETNEKIFAEAYGKFWPTVKRFVNNDGVFDSERYGQFYINECLMLLATIECDYFGNRKQLTRPKSLSHLRSNYYR